MNAYKSSSHLVPKLAPGDLVRALRDTLTANDIPSDAVSIRRSSDTPDGTSLDHNTDWNELWSITDVSVGETYLRWGTEHIAISGSNLFCCVAAGSPDVALANRLHRELCRSLNLGIELSNPYIDSFELTKGIKPLDPEQAYKASAPPVRSQTQQLLAVPEKVTLRWLIDHVSLTVWAALLTLLISIFIGGIAVGQTTFARELLHGLGHWESD